MTKRRYALMELLETARSPSHQSFALQNVHDEPSAALCLSHSSTHAFEALPDAHKARFGQSLQKVFLV